MPKNFNAEAVLEVLKKCWSKESSSLWTATNPAKGQCSVTALVLYTVFGGTILKTKVNDQWHFYNNITRINYDFTDSQFEFRCQYQDIPTNPEGCLMDTSKLQYEYLLQRFNNSLASAQS